MANNEDFYVSFGSNAKAFGDRLKRDLSGAHEQIDLLNSALDSLDAKARQKLPPFVNALNKANTAIATASGTAPPAATPAQQATGGRMPDFDKFHRGMDALLTDFSTISGEIAAIVAGLKKAHGAQARLDRGNGVWTENGRAVKTADVEAGLHPNARRMQPKGSLAADPQLLAMVNKTFGAQSGTRIRDVGKVQLEQASLDRVVNAIHEVRDELRKGNTGRGAGTQANAPAKAKGKGKAPAAAAAAEVEDTEANLEKRLNALQAGSARIQALIAQAGDLVTDEIRENLAANQRMESEIRSELAKAKGGTRKERKAANRASAAEKRGPDLPEEEFDRRKKMRGLLDLALDPNALELAVGKGRGQVGRDDLVAMAKQLTAMGYQTKATTKTRVPELIQGIASSRQAMFAEHGTDIPEELRTGKKIVAAKVSDAVRTMLENANISAAEAAEVFQAREALRLAGLVGHAPKDVTEREALAGGHRTRTAGAIPPAPFANAYDDSDWRVRMGLGDSQITVPPGMVKGGGYRDDVFFDLEGNRQKGSQESLKYLRDMIFGKASNLAQMPGYDHNPFAINSKEEISGPGTEDQAKMFRALRSATAQLDELGDEYKIFADAIEENRAFAERARERLARAAEAGVPTGQALAEDQKARDAKLEEDVQRSVEALRKSGTMMTPEMVENQRRVMAMRPEYNSEQYWAGKSGMQDYEVKKLATDQQKAKEAEQNIQRLQGLMASDRFRAQQQTFENPVYWEGKAKRDPDRFAMYERARQSADRERQTYIGDAAGRAIEGLRLAPGTKDTLIRNIPGMAYRDPGKKTGAYGAFAFTDEDRARGAKGKDAREQLEKMNQGWVRSQKALRQLSQSDDPEEMEQLQRRAENGATKFLNSMKKLFGVVRPIEDVLGQKDLLDENGRYQFLNPKNATKEQQRLSGEVRRQKKDEESVPKSTDESRAQVALHTAKIGLAKALKEQEQQAEELTKLEAQVADADKEKLAALKQQLQELQRHRDKLENAFLTEDPATRKPTTAPTKNTAEIDRLNAHLAATQQREKELSRKEAQQRGVVTRYGDRTDPKAQAARDRLAGTQTELNQVRVVLADVAKNTPKWIAAAEAAAEAELRNAQGDDNDARMHHPGAKKTLAEYPGGDPGIPGAKPTDDLQATKDRLERQIEAVKSEYTKLTSGQNEDPARQRLIDERDALIANKPKLVATISAAREEGDLKENAGYHAAKDQQGREEARIKQINAELDKQGLQRIVKLAQESELTAKKIAGLRDSIEKAEGRLAKAGATPSQEQRAAAKETSADLRKLGDEIERATKAQRRLTELRDAIKKGRAAGDDISGLTAERDALKGSSSYLGRNELKAKRKEYAALMLAEAGGAGGNGANPPTARGGAAGGRGDNSSTNSILRDILTAVNNIHRQLQTGVRVTGAAQKTKVVDKDGNPVAAKKKEGASTGRYYPGGALATQGTQGDERQKALAAAEQQRLTERIREQGAMARIQEAANREQESRQKREADASRRAMALTRAEARAALDLRDAKRLLTVEAEKEFAELRRLSAAGASNEKIVEQQARAYRAMREAMDQQGITARDQKVYAGALLTEANVRPNPKGGTTQGPRVGSTEVDEIARSARSAEKEVHGTFNNMAGAVGQDGPFGRALQAMFGGHGFWARIMGSTGTFIVRNFTAGFVFGITNALQDVIAQAILTESTFIRVSHALEATGRDVGSLRSDLQGISTQYGVSLNDVYEVAAGLTGLFDNTDDLAKATEVVAQLEMISSGALNAKEAMGALASIQGAFAKELGTGVDGLEHVADVLTSVQNNVGTNVEVTAEGVGRMSGLAQQLGLSLEEVAVYTAQIAKLTNQTGAASGEQFSRIISGMQTGRGRKAITEAFSEVKGKSTGVEGMLGARNYSGVLRTMQLHWKDLTDAQRDNVATTIAGARQAAAFAALLNNGEKTLTNITKAQNSHGDATKRTEALMKTLNSQIRKLQTNFQNLANNLVRTGLLNFLGLVLMTTNLVLESVNSLLAMVNDFTDSNSMLKWIKDVGFGIAGMALAIMLLGKSFRGLKATLLGLPSVKRFQDAASAPAEHGIRDTMRERGSRYGRRVGDALGVAIGSRDRRYGGYDPALGYGDHFGGRGYNNAGSRLVGGGLDKFLAKPLQWTGQQVTRFGEVLQRHATQAAVLAAMETNNPTLQQARYRDALRTERVAQGVQRAGGMVGTFATGASEVFQGRGAQLFGQMSQGYEQKGNNFRQAAQQELQAAERARAMGDQAERRRAQFRAAQNTFAARSADAAAHATGKLSSGMDKLSKSGVGADLALAGLSIALVAWIQTMQEQAADAKTANELYKNNWGKRHKKNETDPSKNPEYYGSAEQAYQDMNKKYTDEGSNWDRGWSFAKSGMGSVISGGAGFATFGALGNVRDLNDPLTGETFNKITGTVGGWDASRYGMKEVSGKYEKAQERLKQAVASGATAEELRKINEEFAEDIGKYADKVDGDASITEKNRISAYGLMQQGQVKFTQMVEDEIAMSEGLKKAGNLMADQVARIGELTNQLVPLQGQTVMLREFGNGFDQMYQETGVDGNNPAINNALKDLREGGLDQADAAVAQYKIIKERAKQAKIDYLAALEPGSGVESEGIDDKRQVFEQLMGELANATQQKIQAFVQNSTMLADMAAQNGDYAASEAALRQGIQDLEYEKILGADTPGEKQYNYGISQQQKGLQSRITQEAITQQNAGLQMQSAMGQGEVAGARNNLAQAQNALAEMRKARAANAALGPSVQEIRQQELAVVQAKTQLGQTLQSRDIAAAMLAAAGIWNAAAQAQAQENIAGMQLANAQANFGAGSIEAMNAQANLIQQQHATQEAYDAQAQAARDAQLASIPQGNAVAVANAGVRNAQAALAAAKKYGTASTQYQGALAQLYSAQQQARQATQAVASAQLQVAVAMADAAGHTVKSAVLQLKAARLTLSQALKNAGGAMSAEALQAKAGVISAQAAVRDARLQDSLDTIDFNLEMGKITQASAIHALREILRTQDLTKQQRRQLMLQIKGMQEEMSGSPWNFGDIKLPKPYQMRRYMQEMREQNSKNAMTMARDTLQSGVSMRGDLGGQVYNDNRDVRITIDGGDTAKIRKVVMEVVGSAGRTRTTQSRRGRR